MVIPLLILLAGVLAAQEPNFVLGETSVYGTEHLDPADVRSEFSDEFHRLVAAMAVDDEKRGEELIELITESLKSRGRFAYLSISLGGAITPPNFSVNVMIDVVEEADQDRRMPFRAPPIGEYGDPGEILALWEEYEVKGLDLMMTGSLPNDSECPVLHCLASFDHPDLAPYLVQFNEGARQYEDLLYEIAENHRDGDQRTRAILVLAHTNNPDRLLPVLGRAIYDPNGGVRNYAMRVTLQIARDAPEHDYAIHDLIAALDFPEATDRNKSSLTLLSLVDDPRYRETIRDEAIPTLLRLLRMGPPNNRLPAHEILEKLSGEDFDASNHEAWEAWADSEFAGE